jgi:hypothetical protein
MLTARLGEGDVVRLGTHARSAQKPEDLRVARARVPLELEGQKRRALS